ncbi:hypothetical protein LG3211_2526 [Lysobacter gummosus]|nr:hypothetical protein LG3211_2526 [Lysobacter gummosus]
MSQTRRERRVRAVPLLAGKRANDAHAETPCPGECRSRSQIAATTGV